MAPRASRHQSTLISKRQRGEASAVLRALADPTRLELFTELQSREHCVRELCDRSGLPQPLVSHHLAYLSRAGLVRPRRSGVYSLYAVDPGGMARARDAIGALLDPESLPAEAHPGGNEACCQ